MLPSTLAFGLSDVGGGEILLIAFIALLLFGKNLPVMMRNFGRAYAQFKNTLNQASSEFKKEIDAAAEEIEKAKADVKTDLKLDATVAADGSSTADLPPDTLPEPASPQPLPKLQPPPDTISLDSNSAAPAAESASNGHGTPAHGPEAERRPRPAVSDAAALDELERNIRPPSKIPKPL